MLATSAPGDGTGVYSHEYEYNPHGSMTAMPHLAELAWDHADRMQSADLGGGGTVWFLYDSAGNRVRKIRVNLTGTSTYERIYIGGYEVYRERVSGDLELERQTLHVADDTGRICLVETKTVEDGDPVTTSANISRYQYGNHLGSVGMELDETGQLISYEEFHPYGTTAYRAANSSVEVSPSRYRYTGKERDEETGLGYHGARYYASWLGRWTATDPIGLGDGPNRYGYVRGNPLGMRDPAGTLATPPQNDKPKAAKLENVPVHEGDTREDVLERALLQEFGEKGLTATEAAVLAKDLALLGRGRKRTDTAKADGKRTVKIPAKKYEQIADYVDATIGEERERIYPGLARRAHEKEDEALEKGAKVLDGVDTVLTVVGIAAVAGGVAKALLARAAARRTAREAGEKASVEGAEQVLAASSRHFTDPSQLPPPQEGFTRVFRGTGAPHKRQVSKGYRDTPDKAPSGADDFLTTGEARLHSGTGHDDAVSVSTDFSSAESYSRGPGGGVVVYDVPNDVFAKLPESDPALREWVFKYSIPDEYRRGIVQRLNSAVQ